MKKTYMRCRVGLFAGLISFNALASCANTERTLGMGLCQSKETKKQRELERQYKDQMKKLNNRSSINKDSWYNSKSCCAIIAGTATSVITGLSWYLYYYYNVLPESTTGATMANTTMPFPGNEPANVVADGAPLAPVVNTTMASVGNAIATAAATVAPVGIGLLNAAGIIAALKPNTIQSECKSFNIVDRTSLTQEMIDWLNTHAFSPDAIECLLQQSLDPDSTDLDNNTLSIGASEYGQFESIKKLDSRGANQNLQNKRGYTTIGYANFLKSVGRKIGNFLGSKNNTNLCIKTKEGKSLKDKPGIEFLEEHVQEKIKQCP